MSKRGMFQWEQESLNVLETEWNSGLSAEKIGWQYGWGRGTIEAGLSILEAQGVRLRARRRRKLFIPDEELMAMCRGGSSIRGIAKATGVSRGYIYSLLKGIGKKTDQPGERARVARAADLHLADLRRYHRPFAARVEPESLVPIKRTAIAPHSYCSSSASWDV